MLTGQRVDRKAILIVAIGIAVSADLAGQQLSFFHGRRDYSMRDVYSLRITAGDVNGDGNIDLISAGCCSHAGVLLGNGKGGFRPGPRSETVRDARRIAAADFSGDGKLDILIGPVDFYSGLALQLGDGRGRFGEPIQIPGVTGLSFAIGDFNEDGRPDIFLPPPDNFVLLNTGNGTFVQGSHVPANSAAVTSGDVNGDGHLDIVEHEPRRISVFLGSGAGTFQAPVSSPSTFEAVSELQLADINNDGLPDIVTFQRSQASSSPVIGVFTGSGDGNFGQQHVTNLAAALNGFAVGDFNRDGFADVVNSGQGMMVIRLGKGDGSFAATEGPPIPGFDDDGAIVADVNADGRPDIVLAARWTTAAVFIGNGDGTFMQPPSVELPPGTSGAGKGDFNGDGLVDVAFSNSSAGTVSVLLTDPNGGLLRAGLSPVPDAGALYPGDFNGDAKLDLLSVSPSREAIRTLLGKGDGTFEALQTILLPGFQLSSPSIADFDNDGKQDVIIGSVSKNRFLFFAGNGNGTFRRPQLFPVPIASLRAFTAGDFNLDGNLDLAVCSISRIWILLGHGDGSFGEPVWIERGVIASEMLAADVNHDGRPDVITSEEPRTRNGRNTMKVVLGNGDGTFQKAKNYFAGTGHGRSMTFSDLNNDGNPDIFFVDSEGHDVVVLLGNGDGTFQPVQFFAAGRSPLVVAAIRFNLDAYPDLAVINEASHSLTLLINQTGLNAME